MLHTHTHTKPRYRTSVIHLNMRIKIVPFIHDYREFIIVCNVSISVAFIFDIQCRFAPIHRHHSFGAFILKFSYLLGTPNSYASRFRYSKFIANTHTHALRNNKKSNKNKHAIVNAQYFGKRYHKYTSPPIKLQF